MHTSWLILRSVAESMGPFQEGYSYGEDDKFHADSLIQNPANKLRIPATFWSGPKSKWRTIVKTKNYAAWLRGG